MVSDLNTLAKVSESVGAGQDIESRVEVLVNVLNCPPFVNSL